MSVEIILGAVGLLAIIFLFNSLIGKRNQVHNAFAAIDTYLKKRYDLLPNLIATVKTYMEHEKGTLAEITAMRTRAISGVMNNEEQIELNNKLTKALHSINVAVENYPDLKANTNFLQLQASMNDIEEQLSAARRAYNASVNEFNNAVQMFPSNIIAKILGMKLKTYFEANETERQNINAGDLFKK